ncbi:MAG: DUF6318 family protein [Nocardioides sp.]|uniref:DUF6318 family protein n=1 Tax=Nocardioides sp. TaxID=35761 RepID=UPI003265052C
MSYSFVRRAAIAAAALPLLLAGCTDDDPVPQIPDPTTPSPTASETTAPPEPWEAQTEDGAIAFAEHWIDLLNAARLDETGTEGITDASTPQCASCSNIAQIIDGWQSDGIAYKSKPWTIEQVAVISSEPKEARVGLRILRPREMLTESDGSVVRKDASRATYAATLEWRSGSWLMHELVIPE